MVSQFRPSQRQQRRRKKHSLIIWMRYEQTYLLIPQPGEFRVRYRGCVEPGGDNNQ